MTFFKFSTKIIAVMLSICLFLLSSTSIKAQGVVPTKVLSIDKVNIIDPCSCSDPLNTTVGGVFLFHDVITIEASANQTIEITGVDNSEFLDATGTPISFPVAVSQTSPGIYQTTYYHRSNVSTDISVRIVGELSTTPFTTTNCNATMCTPRIPTMNEWGLMIFGLLVLNLGVVLLGKKKSLTKIK